MVNSTYTNKSIQETLKDHLFWQLELAKLAKSDFEIGLTIIGSINEDGFLEASVTELVESLPKETLCEADVDDTDVELVLEVIQSFEPLGVAARTLTETLLIQLKAFRDFPSESRGHRTPQAKLRSSCKKGLREDSEEART